ncbi:MAG: DEAD/DEAH box helicase [Deltaproteobacteria bacterium]|nr:DEAD/DEAH box helicase [Deltaproteobacteria bacterium]
MSLNPVQFGTEVIDQFGRYLMTTFPIADPQMESQVKSHLRHDIGGERLIAKGPYVYLNRPFAQGPSIATLCAEPKLHLHSSLRSIFAFDSIHKHQELTLRHVKSGKHTVVATGTGSGKTEAFLMPLVDHALHLRDEKAPDGITAILVYPMNALADDQLRRLRPLLAGTGITFGRYTGVTPKDGSPGNGQLTEQRAYTPKELELLAQGKEDQVPIPFEECYSRQDIRDRRPRLLLTNYSQLEYLLLRDRDLDMFREAPLRFLVLDEVHTYTGALGSEVSCLLRRIRHVARKGADEVICIGTSATVQESQGRIDAHGATRKFASRLFGVNADHVELVTEHYRRQEVPRERLFTPEQPEDSRGLLAAILDKTRQLQLRDEVSDLPDEVLTLCEQLCGRAAPEAADNMARAYRLLAGSGVLWLLIDLFKSPNLLAQALPRLRALDAQRADDEACIAELLAYLTLGALVQQEGEPLLRPKLHYFVQGYQGLGCVLDAAGKPEVKFDLEAGPAKDGARIFPLWLCRSCGQHYYKMMASQPVSQDGVGVTLTQNPDRHAQFDPEDRVVYVTEKLIGGTEEGEVETRCVQAYLCRHCGALHDKKTDACRNGKCGKKEAPLPVLAHFEDMKKCQACGTSAKGYEEIVTPVRSSEVADVNILAQTMLSAMREKPLQKLLIFADSRQDAAFQAGWMDERSRRFRLRHVLYETLEKEPERIWSLERLCDHMLERSIELQILKQGAFDDEASLKRIMWFLLEEFASTGQRRASLETLALAEVVTEGVGLEDWPGFYARWAGAFKVEPAALARLVRLVVDYYRRRGLLNHELLQRRWDAKDPEVRKGLVHTYEQYRPQALVIEGASKSSYCKSWMAKRGRTAAQEILAKGLPEGRKIEASRRNEFLDELWSQLVNHEKKPLLRPAQLVIRRHGKLQPIRHLPGNLYQFDWERMGVRLTAKRWLCPSCRKAQSVPPPSGACPEYDCKGTLKEVGREEEHFDVYQYTKSRFVPMKVWEHSAQVPKKERQELEREFKREEGGKYNCLVATPTLELGVDIGKLEMVLMRNVPPTPANYAQRSGRAGRRHRIAAVFTHCRASAHGRYFFQDPRSMIAGEIRVPSFSLRNEPMLKKHVHSTILTYLREEADEATTEILNESFPPFVRSFFAEQFTENGQTRTRYLKEAPALVSLGDLIKTHREALLETLQSVFQGTWPQEDKQAVDTEILAALIDDFQPGLRRHVLRLFKRVNSYRKELRDLATEESSGLELTEEQRNRRFQLQHALKELQNNERLENYSLSYLATDGFLPGYALARDSVTAQCLHPYLEITRPAPVALRELTSANFVYANKQVMRVTKLHLESSAGDEDAGHAAMQQTMAHDPEHNRIYAQQDQKTEGGGTQAHQVFTSFELSDVEMARREDINDREKGRRRVGFKVLSLDMGSHGGGRWGKVANVEAKFLEQHHIRLVNLGVGKRKDELLLFPLCKACGATRSPFATEGEIQRFTETHQKFHGVDRVEKVALHVDLVSDTLELGPFKEYASAANLFESIRIGARYVLDMGANEIDGEVICDEHGDHHALLYDPMPGGSGFLPQIIEYWDAVCEAAQKALENCASKCDKACYSCMKHFRNQQDHAVLDRHMALNMLSPLIQPLDLQHKIPPVAAATKAEIEKTDSDAEITFAEVCAAHGFPVPPVAGLKVTFDDGNYTVADWAYPEAKLLIFIDGMGKHLHGDPQKAKSDALKRAKAELLGYKVVAITAEALKDEVSMNVHFQVIQMRLEEK